MNSINISSGFAVNSLKREWETVGICLRLTVSDVIQALDVAKTQLSKLQNYEMEERPIEYDEKTLGRLTKRQLIEMVKERDVFITEETACEWTLAVERCEIILEPFLDLIADLPAKIKNELSRFSLLKFYDIL